MRSSVIYKLLFFSLALMASPSFVFSSEAGDTTHVSTSLLYELRAKGDRSNGVFPWNIEPDSIFPINRAAYMLKVDSRDRISLYVKFSSNSGHHGRAFDKYRFGLEQGHIDLKFRKGSHIVFFSGEKRYRENRLFINSLSSYSDFTDRWGYGYLISSKIDRFIEFGYIHSEFRGRDKFLSYGGLPCLDGGGDLLDHIALSFSPRWAKLGLSASSLRSDVFGDHVFVGADARWLYRGTLFVTEFSKSIDGSLRYVTGDLFKGYDLGRIRKDGLHSFFRRNDAFAAGVYGAGFKIDGLGKINIEPGYIFSGRDYVGPQGEIRSGRTESFVNIWWKHPVYALVCSIEANDTYTESQSKSKKSLIPGAYMRFKGGVALKSRLFLFNGEEPSAATALINSNDHYELRMTARVDLLGRKNLYSFFSHGWMNLSDELAAGVDLYLTPAGESLYSLFIKVHDHKRFYLSLVYGSAREPLEEVSLVHAVVASEPESNRSIWLTARFALGSLLNE
ncbi:hypothetical protein DRQ05_06540 [bacterium]|nr:MAG: hypothetical protein DRQ05_06540 [bacterium]